MPDLNHQQRRRPSHQNGSLKQMMSSLLPSLDASIDSHFSLTDATDTTHATGSSVTNGYHTSGTSFHTSATGSTLHSDLGDSSEEEEEDDMMMSSSRRISHRLKKAFGKITKKSSSKRSSKMEIEKEKKTSTSTVLKYFDNVSVDDSEEEEEETLGSSEFYSARETSDPEQAQPRRRGGTGKNIASNNNKNRNIRRVRSSNAGSDDNVEYSSQEVGVRPQRRSRRSSTSRSQDRSDDPRQRRSSSRRGGGKASGGGGLVGKRMPPKSKSFDDPGRKVTRPAGFSRSESYKERERNSTKSSSVTAKEAIPNPRPNLRKHKSERRQSSSVHQSRKPTGKGTNNIMSKARSFRKSKSSVGPETGQALQVKERSSKKPIRRSRSLNKVLLESEDDGEDISRVSSFQSLQHQQTTSRERSTSRNRDKRKGNTAMHAAAPTTSCKHGETLGECCYDKHPKNTSKKTTTPDNEPPQLNSFIGSRAVDPAAAADDLSIDTMDTHYINRELRNKTNEHERRRSKSRSRSPSVTRAGARSKSRSRSPSVTSRSQSRSRSPSVNRGQPNRRRSISLARNGNSERGRRSSSGIPSMEKRVSSSRLLGGDGTSERGKRSSLERKDKGTRSNPGVRNGSSERGRRSTSSGESSERERSESRSRRGSAAQSKRGRSKSVCRDAAGDAKNSSSQTRLPSVSRPVRSRSNSKTQKEAPRKQYETLSKEDIDPGGLGADNAASRRPRSLSRTRRSGDKNKQAGQEILRHDQHARVSRSLSRTRSGSSQGIGNYLASKQPERKSEDDESNSQTTGTNTTGSHEVTYSTPSWMWSKGNTSAATGSLQNSFQTSNSSSFNNSFQTAKTSHDSFQTSGSTLMDSSFETAASEMTAAAGCSATVTGKNSNQAESNGGASLSSLSLTATPGTKARHFYGKIMEKEQAEIRAQSQQLFQNVTSVKTGIGARPKARP